MKYHKFNDMYFNDKQTVLGEGSYGCVIRPGFNSKLQEQRKTYATKISKIDFYSKNEYLISQKIKRIHDYSRYFLPIISQSVIQFDKLKESSFDITRCSNLNDENSISNFIKTSFFLLTLKYLDGTGPVAYFTIKKNDFTTNQIIKKYLYTFNNLNNAIVLLNSANIVHNDLYDRNLLIKKKNEYPIILDFGLSYDIKSIFHNKIINIVMLKKFLFSYKPNHFNHLHEKNFINFIISNYHDYESENDSGNYYSIIDNVEKQNNLTLENIKICTSNFQKVFQKLFHEKNNIHTLFSNQELNYFLNSFEKYYSKFANKKKYPTYYEILVELLPNVFMYTDLYSLIFLYLEIYDDNIDNIDNNLIISILFLLFKKIILPDPIERINPIQLKSILNNIFYFIKKVDLNNEKNEIDNFIIEFDNNLKKIGINYDIFYNKNYAYIDFHVLFKNKLKYLKKLNLKLKN